MRRLRSCESLVNGRLGNRSGSSVVLQKSCNPLTLRGVFCLVLQRSLGDRWKRSSFPSCIRGFDSLRPLQGLSRTLRDGFVGGFAGMTDHCCASSGIIAILGVMAGVLLLWQEYLTWPGGR